MILLFLWPYNLNLAY